MTVPPDLLCVFVLPSCHNTRGQPHVPLLGPTPQLGLSARPPPRAPRSARLWAARDGTCGEMPGGPWHSALCRCSPILGRYKEKSWTTSRALGANTAVDPVHGGLAPTQTLGRPSALVALGPDSLPARQPSVPILWMSWQSLCRAAAPAEPQPP